VVFDILFSDPDVYNPDSDAYFDAAIAAAGNTFFPMLRLDPADDALSQIKPAMIPGMVARTTRRSAMPAGGGAAALQGMLEGGRLGLHNIYPDADGIVRQYPVYRDDYGWKIPRCRCAFPAAEVSPARGATGVLNWRGRPFTYRSVSFSDVFADLTSKNKQRPPDEFTAKIVIIRARLRPACSTSSRRRSAACIPAWKS